MTLRRRGWKPSQPPHLRPNVRPTGHAKRRAFRTQRGPALAFEIADDPLAGELKEGKTAAGARVFLLDLRLNSQRPTHAAPTDSIDKVRRSSRLKDDFRESHTQSSGLPKRRNGQRKTGTNGRRLV